MQRYAKVMNEHVEFVVESDKHPGEGWIACPSSTSVSDVYDVATQTFSVPKLPIDLRPQIVITRMVTDQEDVMIDGTTDLTCTEGTTVTVFAELQHQGIRLPMTQKFRMPLHASDGRNRVLLANMVDGVISIKAPLRESGVWQVTEAAINEGLPPEMHMCFAGLRLFVLVE